MKHRIISLALLFSILVGLIGTIPVSAASITVTVDGTAVPYTTNTGSPYKSGNAVMVPVQQTMTYYGVIPTTDSGSGHTLLSFGNKEVRIIPGQAQIIVNGTAVDTEAAAVVTNGILYAPITELTTGLGGYCDFSGNQLTITTQAADSQIFLLELQTPLSQSTIWGTWNSANSLYNSGSYQSAIPLYEQCVSFFLTYNDNYNGISLCFHRLATSYAKTGSYAKAAAAYNRASYYWSLHGDQETSLVTHTCDLSLREELSLYLKTTDLSLSSETTHQVNYEPASGVVLGYTNDIQDTYPTYTQKDAGMWLKYFPYGDAPEDVFQFSKFHTLDENTVVLLAVEPTAGLSSVNTQTTKELAQYLHNSGKRIMVRFANEMNESNCLWYTSDPQEYIDTYIAFAKVFRQYAPEIPLVWSPNFFPSYNVDDYYPGDEYVDYVGISSYWFSKYYSSAEQAAGYDVLGTGVKTQRWSQQIDFLYNHYGYKKPLLITEGAASYIDSKNGSSIVSYAASSIFDEYTYLAIRYPNLKYAVYFDINKDSTKYKLNDHADILNAYNRAVSDDSYTSSYTETASHCYVSFDTLAQDVTIPKKDQLCAYVKYAQDDLVAGVRYSVNGTAIGTATTAPYTIDYDLTYYSGTTVTIKMDVLAADGSVLTSKQFRATIAGSPFTSFTDVTVPRSFYYVPVMWAVDQNITSGMTPNTFEPDTECTRAQVVTFLWRAAGKPKATSRTHNFTDVREGTFYYEAMLWAVEKGITKGMTNTTFEPETICSRAQVVTFLWRAMNQPTASSASHSFTDVKQKAFYYQAMLWAVENGITTGDGSNTIFNPEGTCTRAQVVTFLYRTYNT